MIDGVIKSEKVLINVNKKTTANIGKHKGKTIFIND